MYDFLKVAQHQTDAENAEISAPEILLLPFCEAFHHASRFEMHEKECAFRAGRIVAWDMGDRNKISIYFHCLLAKFSTTMNA